MNAITLQYRKNGKKHRKYASDNFRHKEIKFLNERSENKFLKTKEKYASLYQEMSELIGVENMEKMYSKYKGQQIVFPQKLYSSQYIYSYIVENQGVMSVRQMSEYLQLSDRRIRQIITEIRQGKK